MNAKSTVINATADLLARSTTGEVSTRAICEAAHIQQPALYRLFGDKDHLLAATVDSVWDEYLGMKRAAEASADPLDDLRSGWDSHTAFALAHPSTYKLMFASTLKTPPDSAAEAMRLLRLVLERLAAQGRLRFAPSVAAQMVMAANTGIALALVMRPELYPDASISTQVRDAAVNGILVSPHGSLPDNAQAVAATTLEAGLTDLPLSPAESALFVEWLARIQTTSSSR